MTNTNYNFDTNNTNNVLAEELSLEAMQAKLFGNNNVSETQTTVETELNPDLMPSQSTMTMSFVRNYKDETIAPAKVEMNKATKIAIASYVAVVCLLIVGIALCSFFVSDTYATLAVSQGEYVSQQETLAQVEQAIASLTDEQLVELGLSMGFVPIDATNSYTYDLLETRPEQTFQIEGNWFDNVCDWITGIFG
ncbi:MAG: hypothetical protein IJF72_04745 [Clostridia bacterium]|nr:hypothetical protein [Clostridia bacterium]